MDISQLRAFYQASKCGNFSRASEELFTSQPALSRQIANLEASVGIQLFSRHGKGVTLTDAGRRLLPYAEKILVNVDEAEKMLSQLLNLRSGEFSLVTCSTIGDYLLPATIAEYRKRFPEVKVNVTVNNSKDVLSKVIARDTDLGILPGPITKPGLYLEPCWEDELVLTVPPGHPLLVYGSLHLHDCFDENLLIREEGSSSRAIVENFLEENKISPKGIIELSSTEAIKRGIISGIGIGFLPPSSIELEVKTGILRVIQDEEFRIPRQIFCFYPKDHGLPPTALAFKALISKR